MATSVWIESASRPDTKPGTGSADRFTDEAILNVLVHELDVDQAERDRASRGVRRLANTGNEGDAEFAAEVLGWLDLPGGALLTRWPADRNPAVLATCLAEARTPTVADDEEPDDVEDDEPATVHALPRRDWRWQDDAACIDEGLGTFFSPDGERQPERDIRERKAKAICAQCPVLRQCGDFAMGDRPQKYGLWAGLGEEDRAYERRRRMRRANDQARLLESLSTDAADEGVDLTEAAS